MNTKNILNMNAQRDEEGFVIDSTLWSEKLANLIAKEERLCSYNESLNIEQLQIIYKAREFYYKFNQSPKMKAFILYLKRESKIKGQNFSSTALMQLFPLGPGETHHIKLVCKIAGLPKPFGCK